MNTVLLVSLLAVVAVLIAGCVLLQRTARHRKRRTGKVHRRKKSILRGRDHGAHIARQHGYERSAQWQSVRKEHLFREPVCVVCGYKGRKLHVHHIKPFHLHPHLELDPHNLITLCQARGRDHHLLLGHLNEWESYNEHIRDDAKRFHRKTAREIRADLVWQKKMKLRP